MREIKTSWAKKTSPYGAFDDYVIIESIETKERVLIRPEEFDYLTNQLYDNWILKKSKYIQLLREWNESTGFNDINGKPSIINDNQNTINAFSLIEGVDKVDFTKVTKKDLKLILTFLRKSKNTELKIWQE